MLGQIPIGKLKQAYELSGHDIDTLMFKLLPANVFPYVLWQNAYADFWHWSIRATTQRYQLKEPEFPDAGALPERYFPTSLHRTLIVRFFDEMVKAIEISALEKGFDYIIEATYGEESNFLFLEQKKLLFQTLYEEERRIDNLQRVSGPLGIESMQAVDYFCVSEFFPDTIVVDKVAAIRHLAACGFPLRQEVKGITQSLVGSIIKATVQETASTPTAAPAREEPAAEVHFQEHGNMIRVPAALWEGKPDTAVRDTMRAEFDDSVIAYVLFRWCKVQKTRIGKLLSEKKFEDEKSYRNFVDKLLEKTDSLTITKG